MGIVRYLTIFSGHDLEFGRVGMASVGPISARARDGSVRSIRWRLGGNSYFLAQKSFWQKTAACPVSQETLKTKGPRRDMSVEGLGKEIFRRERLMCQRSADVDQIVGDDAKTDPTLHARLSFI